MKTLLLQHCLQPGSPILAGSNSLNVSEPVGILFGSICPMLSASLPVADAASA